MPTLQITLIKDIDDFCMSKGETIEFKDGGFKRLENGREDYYPNFGPYHQLNEIAEIMCFGSPNQEMVKTFTAKEIK